MKTHTIQYHNWSDIIPEICKEMSIEEKDFTAYHNLTGGENKNLGYEWVDYFDPDMGASRLKHFVLDQRDMDYKLEVTAEDGKAWLEPFVRAVYAVWKKHCITHIQYSW
jgi:hypothetical protein